MLIIKDARTPKPTEVVRAVDLPEGSTFYGKVCYYGCGSWHPSLTTERELWLKRQNHLICLSNAEASFQIIGCGKNAVHRPTIFLYEPVQVTLTINDLPKE